MNITAIVCIVLFITIPLTWGMCELIDHFLAGGKRGKQTYYVYKSRKLHKTRNVDKVGE